MKNITLLLNFAAAAWTLFITYSIFIGSKSESKGSEGVMVSEYYLLLVLLTLFVSLYTFIVEEEDKKAEV
jgi:hypothetical protein